jgi:hypothetical protein
MDSRGRRRRRRRRRRAGLGQGGHIRPQHIYSLTTPESSQPQNKTLQLTPRFYLGGTIYTNWTSVPARYKVDENPSNHPDPDRSTGTVFKFVWK